MNNLIIDEYPLMVLPKLAVKIGLNEAIILQQVHYWLNKSNHIHDDKKWIYNTYEGWQKQFPFWSSRTVRRSLNSLSKQGILITGNFNKAGFDNTKWYSIDYLKLNKLVARPCGQNDQTDRTECPNGSGQNDQTNTRDYTEITTENTNTKSSSDEHDDIASQVIDYLNEKADRHFKKTDTNKRLINARVKEGFELKDFKKAIDNKTTDWAKNTKYSKYLRPATLFRASKFEGYVNEQQLPQGTNPNQGLNIKETLPDWAKDGYQFEPSSNTKAEDVHLKEGELPF